MVLSGSPSLGPHRLAPRRVWHELLFQHRLPVLYLSASPSALPSEVPSAFVLLALLLRLLLQRVLSVDWQLVVDSVGVGFAKVGGAARGQPCCGLSVLIHLALLLLLSEWELWVPGYDIDVC